MKIRLTVPHLLRFIRNARNVFTYEDTVLPWHQLRGRKYVGKFRSFEVVTRPYRVTHVP